MKTYDWFWDDWLAATEAFEVVTFDRMTNTSHLVVEAGTGSVYEIFASDFRSRLGDSRRALAMMHPWSAVWTAAPKDLLYPDYVHERWAPQRDIVHGGDLCAVTIALNIANGLWLAEVVGKAKIWGQQGKEQA